MGVERNRNWCLITYHSEDTIRAVLFANKSRIRHYAYILHDKDTKEDGSPQEVHFHILLQFNNALSLSAVRNLFPKEQNTLGQAMRDKADCFVYLDHSDCPDKFHYDHRSIKSDDLRYWENVECGGDNEEKLMGILDDILSHVPLREIARRYGRDVVIYYSRYKEFAIEMADEEKRMRDLNARNARIANAEQKDYDLFDINKDTGEVPV